VNSKAPSALRRAIDAVNDAQLLQPITDAELEALGDVSLWRIVVEPYIPKQRGLIARPPSVDEAERVVSKVGRIVQVGEFAYQSKTTSGLDLSKARVRAEVGEYWLFEMYAGQEIHLRSGHILRLLTDTELLFRVKDPDLLKGYAE
jgi:hypothetical protein